LYPESEEESGLGHGASQEGSSDDGHAASMDTNHNNVPQSESRHARKPTKGSEPLEKWERDEMEQLLMQLNGHLGE